VPDQLVILIAGIRRGRGRRRDVAVVDAAPRRTRQRPRRTPLTTPRNSAIVARIQDGSLEMAEEFSERTVLLVRLIDRGFPALAVLFRWAGLAAIAYFASQSIGYLAGQQTDATISIVVDFLTKTGCGITVGASLMTGLLGIAYGTYERQLRYRKVEYLQGRVRELETLLDPNRSTSGLTPQGRTNPRDEY
jgi:hypothetical protein